MNRAFLVYGAESSGCRFVTSAFMACGCDGDAGHSQRFDKGLVRAGNMVVWRRSFPHGSNWPNIPSMVRRLRAQGYNDIMIIVTVRDYHSMLESQLKRGHIKTRAKGEENIRKAYAMIFAEALKLKLPVRLAVYEAYVHNPQVMQRMLESCGLTLLSPLRIRDEDAKYYEASPMAPKKALALAR